MKPLIALLILALVLLANTERVRSDNTGFLYAYGLLDSHSQDAFYSVDALKPIGRSYPWRPYVQLILQRDAGDVSGLLPQPLNDSYGLFAGGMQYQGRSGLRIFAQMGQTFAFGPQTPAAQNLKRSDFRGGLELYRNWNDPINNPRRSIGSFYGSATYYGRYANELVYMQAERGHEYGSLEHPIQAYGRLAAGSDTRRYFYNNLINFTIGARLLPLGHEGPSLALEESYNRFVGPLEPITAAGFTREYFSFRPIVSFGASF